MALLHLALITAASLGEWRTLDVASSAWCRVHYISCGAPGMYHLLASTGKLAVALHLDGLLGQAWRSTTVWPTTGTASWRSSSCGSS